MTQLTLLDPDQPRFPSPALALNKPDGLLAIGGNLRPATLINAYQQGIFPWYSADEPLMWWSPSSRAVIIPDKFHVSRSLAKFIRKNLYSFSHNLAFNEVLECCSKPRCDDAGTWITPEMKIAYQQLHQLGAAHSLEVWQKGKLVGGVYGVVVGSVFCGESMFSAAPNASKLALHYLTQKVQGLTLIDCQIPNPHLTRLGSETMAREVFLEILQKSQHQQLNWL